MTSLLTCGVSDVSWSRCTRASLCSLAPMRYATPAYVVMYQTSSILKDNGHEYYYITDTITKTFEGILT